ncbi:hypothetical protein [Senegalia sp. (in: firmicutes)]|uniref:hypothetical protein n=1 Tax=Senegalia sp. (in: firmicutes) TaxID=1924098 RepID=UPI003F94C0AB
MNRIWEARNTIKYGIFAIFTSVSFLVILSGGIESQINIYTIIGTLIIFLLQLQRFLKIIRLSISDDKIIEKQDTIFFTIGSGLMVIYLILTRSMVGVYMVIHVGLFILYMIYFSKNIKLGLILFVMSLIPFELLILTNGLRIVGNIVILAFEIFSVIKIKNLIELRKFNNYE